jgi:hypothetical protein
MEAGYFILPLFLDKKWRKNQGCMLFLTPIKHCHAPQNQNSLSLKQGFAFSHPHRAQQA